jgi:hypothetical protein
MSDIGNFFGRIINTKNINAPKEQLKIDGDSKGKAMVVMGKKRIDSSY